MKLDLLFVFTLLGVAAAEAAAEAAPQLGQITRSVGGLPTGIPRPTFTIPSRPSGSGRPRWPPKHTHRPGRPNKPTRRPRPTPTKRPSWPTKKPTTTKKPSWPTKKPTPTKEPEEPKPTTMTPSVRPIVTKSVKPSTVVVPKPTGDGHSHEH